jgi:hypothetical protein
MKHCSYEVKPDGRRRVGCACDTVVYHRDSLTARDPQIAEVLIRLVEFPFQLDLLYDGAGAHTRHGPPHQACAAPTVAATIAANTAHRAVIWHSAFEITA